MSARFGLSAGELTRLRTILETALDRIERVAVFGSRAEGRHRPHSDLDRVLYGTADEAVCDRLWTLFQDSPLPFSVDVKHYEGIASPPLRAHIDAAARPLFVRTAHGLEIVPDDTPRPPPPAA